MSNIFEIEKDILDIYYELEENGGEMTPELEEKLVVSKDEFQRKVYGYVNVIKSLNSDLASIKEEQARLKALCERKERTATNLKNILVEAIDKFGDVKKSGVKYIDYGTGEVSIRKSEAVEVNDDLVDYVGRYLTSAVTYDKNCNQLDVKDSIELSDIITDVAQNTEMGVSADDLRHIDIKFEVSVPLSDLSDAKGYPVLREIAKYSDTYKLSANVSKSTIKHDLKENGSCAPNLAKLVQNKSLTIK